MAERTCIFQSGKLFFPSFSETGQPIRENTAGSVEDEAMDEFVEETSSDYHVKMVLM